MSEWAAFEFDRGGLRWAHPHRQDAHARCAAPMRCSSAVASAEVLMLMAFAHVVGW